MRPVSVVLSARAVSLIVALLGAIVLAIVATTPPSPRGAATDRGEFAAGRAMADVRRIAARPHPSGSAADADLRAYLASRLRALGLVVSEDPFAPDAARDARFLDWHGPGALPGLMVNVIGVLPGLDRGAPALALMAHHDSVAGSPAAADDGAGLAAILELLRAIRNPGGPHGVPPRDIVVILTDGEEIGLDGAAHFFAVHPLRRHIGALINLEARGGGGRATLFQTSPDDGAAMALATSAIRHPSGSSLGVFVYRVLPNDTDLTMALGQPYAAYNFAFIGRPWLYHSPLATADRLDQGALQDIGAQTLDLARALLQAPHLPGRSPDVVFFDLFGWSFVTWPTWVGWPLLALGLALIVPPLRSGSARAALAGAARVLGLLGLTVLLTMTFNLLSYHAGRANYYDRLAAMPRLEVMAAAAALAAFVVVIGPWRPTRAQIAGAALPLWGVGLVLQGLAPPAAYVVIVPVCLAGISERLAAMVPAQTLTRMAIAMAVTGYQIAFAHQVMQGVGADLPLVVALPLALATLALLPLWAPLPTRVRRGGLLALLGLALLLSLTLRAAPLASSVPAYSQR